MKRTLPFLALLACLTGCTQAPDSAVTNQALRKGGFEAFRDLGYPSAQVSAHARNLIQALDAGRPLKERLTAPPDIELQAFRLGSEHPELYSVWLERRIVYAGSYQQAVGLGLANQPLPVFFIPSSP